MFVRPVKSVPADRVIPKTMFDPELTIFRDGTRVVIRCSTPLNGATGVTIGEVAPEIRNSYPYQRVQFSDGSESNVAPHVLHRL